MAPVVTADERAPRRVARWFCWCALCVGLLYVLITPPFAAQDELEHLARAYQLSSGQLRQDRDDAGRYSAVPESWRPLMRKYGKLPDLPHRRVSLPELASELSAHTANGLSWKIHGDQFSARSPLPYLPMLPALWIARVLSLPPAWLVYLTRISVLSLFCALTAGALRISGKLAWGLFALASMPALSSWAGAASPTGIKAALVLLWLALFERALDARPEIPSARLRSALLGVFTLLVGYSPICALLAVLLPAVRWTQRDSRALRIACAALSVILSLAFTAALDYLGTGEAPLIASAQVRAQLAWLATHPIAFVAVVARTLFAHLDDYLLQLLVVRAPVAGQMRFSAGLLATLQVELILLVAIGSAHTVGIAREASASARYLAAAGLYVGGVFISTLVTSDAIGRLQGVEAHLFFPAAPLLVAWLARARSPIAARWLVRGGGGRVLAAALALNLVWLLMLTGRYYAENQSPWKY